jgi:antitoxin YefM
MYGAQHTAVNAGRCCTSDEGKFMTAIGYACFRDNLELFMDKVSDECETVTVAMENNKNVVVLSEESYNNLMENLHVLGSEANYDWLLESRKQLEEGSASTHELTRERGE